MTHYCECPMCPNQGTENEECGCVRNSESCDRICTLEAELVHHVNRANRLEADRDEWRAFAMQASAAADVNNDRVEQLQEALLEAVHVIEGGLPPGDESVGIPEFPPVSPGEAWDASRKFRAVLKERNK